MYLVVGGEGCTHGIGEVGEAGCTLHFTCVEGAGLEGTGTKTPGWAVCVRCR